MNVPAGIIIRVCSKLNKKNKIFKARFCFESNQKIRDIVFFFKTNQVRITSRFVL